MSLFSATNPNILKELRCRTCLKILFQNEFHTLNENLVESNTITSLLNFFKSDLVTWPESSGKICNICFLKLSSFANFIQNFLKVENLLNIALSNLSKFENKYIDLNKNDNAFISHNKINVDSCNLNGIHDHLKDLNKNNGSNDVNGIDKDSIISNEINNDSHEVNGTYFKPSINNIDKKASLDQDFITSQLNLSISSEFLHSTDQNKNNFRHLNKPEQILFLDEVEKCTDCSEQFSQNSQKRLYKCKKCDATFINENKRQKHNRTVHFDQNKTKQTTSNLCFVCGKTFKTGSTLQTHIKKVHVKKEETGTYYCDRCPKTCKTATNMYDHKRLVHEDKHPKKCEHCGKVLLGRLALRNHQKLKHPKKSDLLFKCAVCEKAFNRGDYYKRHMSSHANAEIRGHYGSSKKYIIVSDPVICNICNKTYKNLNCLKIHLKSHVKMRKRFKCKYCEITFATQSSRKRHESRHDDPTFANSCRICYKTLGSQEELKHHMKNHKKLKYKCGICNERFPSKYLFNNHCSEHNDVSEFKKEHDDVFSEALKPSLIKCD